MIPNKALLFTLGAIGALGASTGCMSALPPETSGDTVAGDTPGAEAQTPAQIDPAAALAHVDQNLARLKALQVFEVGQLIVDMPEGAMNCYGPCPGTEAAVEKAREQAAVRLEKLTTVAVSASEKPAVFLKRSMRAVAPVSVTLLQWLMSWVSLSE